MSTANYKKGDSFSVQFAWKLPDGDYIRAVFQADVLDLVPAADKYIVQLTDLIAGRQETDNGIMRPKHELSQEYWELVGDIIGRKISIAFEVDDGRPLHLRLATLTGEHNFFKRFSDATEMVKKMMSSSENTSP